ncbi:hypothetical protein ACP26L_18840 [Paenibacillus sp. S-38]|uniref:hypothetical protein n=1 Tax=Paenibacillus sp. S-38 TaxID=3416710 RepID=UPI003CEA9738
MKRWISLFLLVGIILGISYYYIFNQAKDALAIDASYGMMESAAHSLINTEQKYGFRLVNESDKDDHVIRN